MKKRSIFGLIVAFLTALEVIYMYVRMYAMASSSEGMVALGAVLGIVLIRPYLLCAAISGVVDCVAFLARIKWLYLIGALVMLVGIFQLPAIIGIPAEPIILIVLMVVAFVIDWRKNK